MALKKVSFFLSSISGIILYISFSFNNMWWLAFFAYIPLSYLLLKYEFKKRTLFINVLIFSIFYYAPLVHWLLYLVNFVANSKAISIISLSIGILLIAFIQSVYIYISLIAFLHLKKGTMADAFILAILLTIAEFFQRITPFLAFPWSQTGVIVTPFTPFIQSASLFGSSFISLLVILINTLFAFCIINIKDKRKVFKSALIAVVLLVLNSAYGIIRMTSFNDSPDIGVLSVQGNFSDLEKWNATKEEMLERYLSLTKENVLDDTMLVVWPEPSIFC